MKTPITSKAARSVQQYQLEVDVLKERARSARTAIKTNKSALFSKKSALIAVFGAGAYLGTRPKEVKVADPSLATKKSVSLLSLMNTALSLMALRRKAQLLTLKSESTHSAQSSTS